MEQRIVDLEIRFTHQDELLRELSALVYEQRKVIDRMERKVATLEEKLTGGDGGPIPHEKPPHY